MHVPRLADQAIDENKRADRPADRLDREITGWAIVNHGQMRREARLPREAQARRYHRLAERVAKRCKTCNAIIVACQNECSLPMGRRETYNAIENNSEWLHRNSAGCFHRRINDGRRTRAAKSTNRKAAIHGVAQTGSALLSVAGVGAHHVPHLRCGRSLLHPAEPQKIRYAALDPCLKAQAAAPSTQTLPESATIALR